MSKYYYEYSMELKLNAKCKEHAFSIMCYPKDNERQKIFENKVTISPDCVIKKEEDWAGNVKGVGLIQQEHTDFKITVTGLAETYANFFEEYDDNVSIFYKYPTELTYAGEKIKELSDLIEHDTKYKMSLEIMHLVNRTLVYKKGETDVYTSAEEALNKKMGVCQDYAHLMISLLRHKKIPARYVVGLVVGEGETHAWVEANLNGYWYAFDPTVDKLVGDSYLKFSHGRDANDCCISRGSFKGYANQTQIIKSIMKVSEE